LLDERRKFFGFRANQCTVTSNLSRLRGKLAAQVVGGGANDGQRSAQFVGDPGNEVHLQFGEVLRAARKAHQRVDGGKNEQQ